MQSSSWLWLGLPLSLLFAACRFGFESHAAAPPMPDPVDLDGSPSDPEDGSAEDGSDGVPDDPNGRDAGPVGDPPDASSGPTPDAGQLPPVDASMTFEDAGTPTYAVSFAGSGTSTLIGGTGGSTYSDSCPQGYAIVGYRGYTASSTSWVMRLQAVCGEFTVEGDTAPVVRMGETVALAEHGTDGSVAWERMCPTRHAVVGFSGRTGQYLDQLTFRCAEITAEAGPNLGLGSEVDLASIGGMGGTAFALTRCPLGQVARAHTGRSGQWVDALGLRCGTPTPL